MIQILFGIIFVGSLTGIAILAWQKVPALKNIEVDETFCYWDHWQNKIVLISKRAKAGLADFLKSISWEIFLQKILSKIKIFTLRTEKRVGGWLEDLRKRSKERIREKEERKMYWKRLSRFSKKKKK